MKHVLSVAAFTQGGRVPSARFRVQALMPHLAQRHVAVRDWPARYGAYPPRGLLARLGWLPTAWLERRRALDEAADFDVALFQRELISTLATHEVRWKKPAVLDVDDAIWLNQRFGGIDRIARHFGHVICGNAYIAERFSTLARTWIVPTAVDTQRYRPGVRADVPVMVWSGSASGLAYLVSIEEALGKVLRAVPAARLRVVCDAAPQLTGLPPAQVEYIPWSEQTEVAALRSAWVGLMPMPDTPWTRGKCSFKMLTYMACGLPVVVSPYGMNAEVLAMGETGCGAVGAVQWCDALTSLLRDVDTAARMGTQGRAVVERDFALPMIAQRVAGILREVAGVERNGMQEEVNGGCAA